MWAWSTYFDVLLIWRRGRKIGVDVDVEDAEKRSWISGWLAGWRAGDFAPVREQMAISRECYRTRGSPSPMLYEQLGNISKLK